MATPSHDYPTIARPSSAQAAELCLKADQLTLMAISESSRSELSSFIDQGWTPFLHDFMQLKYSTQLRPWHAMYGQLEAAGPLFELILDRFPAAATSIPLIPDASIPPKASNTFGRTDYDRKRAPSPWLFLGNAQRRAMALHEDGAAISKLPRAGDAQTWLLCACQSLLPKPEPVPDFSAPPFFGYFSTSGWQRVAAKEPSLAYSLCMHLLAHCCALEAASCSQATPWREAAESLAASLLAAETAKGSKITLSCAHFPAFALYKCVELDAVAPAMALALALGCEPLAAESEQFSKLFEEALPPAANLIAASTHRGRSIKDRWGYFASGYGFSKKLPQTPSEAAQIAFDMQGCNEISGSTLGALAKIPLLTLCALFAAPRCWEAFGAIEGFPVSMANPCRQEARLPSPIDILRRLALHEQRALDAGSASSAAILRTNLLNDKARAERALGRLALTDELVESLTGDGNSCRPDARARAFAALSPPERAAQTQACLKALAKTSKGRQTSMNLRLSYDWVAHLIAMGARVAFLKDKLPIGALGTSGSFFDLATKAGQTSRFDPADLAAIEQDDLAASLRVAIPSTAPLRKSRL